MNENKDLEAECADLQNAWMEQERSYQALARNDKLSDLGSLQELYEGKIAEQQELKEKQDKLQGGTNHSKEYCTTQKTMFANLNRLLELKAKLHGAVE